jgi:hypothetical protein
MSISISELSQIREITKNLLEELQLDAYLFEIEPHEAQWELKVECAIEEGWETVTLTVVKEQLLRAADDPKIRRSLLREWHEALSACLLKTRAP